MDPFEELAQRLRMVLAATGQAKVWEPEGRDARKQFRIVLVDKVNQASCVSILDRFGHC